MLDALEAPDDAGPAAAAPDPAWRDALDREMRQGYAADGLLGSYAALNRALGWS